MEIHRDEAETGDPIVSPHTADKRIANTQTGKCTCGRPRGAPDGRQATEFHLSAIAYKYSKDVNALCDGIEAFLWAEVVAWDEKHAEALDSDNRYTKNGRFTPEVLRLITEVRMASANACYYTMCAPPHIGGQGLGYVAWFAVWGRISRFCGYRDWLGHYAISH